MNAIRPTNIIICRECAAPIEHPRRNQSFCSKACNHANRARNQHRNSQPATTTTKVCLCCAAPFDRSATAIAKDFCGTPCQQAEANLIKSHAGKMAKALAQAYSGKTRKLGPVSAAWRELKQAQTELRRARQQAREEKGDDKIQAIKPRRPAHG